MSLQRVKSVIVGHCWSYTSWSLLLRLKLVGFIYISVRRGKDVSDRSSLLTYQLRRRDDVSAWSRTLISVTKMDQFHLVTGQFVFSASPVVRSHYAIS